jgi:CspA family cold shock protein
VAGDILDSVWCAGIIEIPKWRQRAMATGIVKWFNPTKGYGFIQPQGGGKEVFVHISAVERAGLSTLNEGQQVQYEEVANKGKTWGWIARSPDQKPEDLDAILRGAGVTRADNVSTGTTNIDSLGERAFSVSELHAVRLFAN